MPRRSSWSGPWAASAGLVLALLGLAVGCSGGAGIGHSCDNRGDCSGSLQCLGGVCTPPCTVDVDCGDGFVCDADGACQEVASEIGDRCQRERDCGPGQACRLDAGDSDGDGVLAGSCQLARPGGAVGSRCDADADCRSGICSIGRCSEMCEVAGDCPSGTTCVSMPRILDNSTPLFRGCLQSCGHLDHAIDGSVPYQELSVAVPSNARSFALVTTSDDETQLVGAARVTSPSGTLLYATPFSLDEFYQNPLRHQPEQEISTLLVPNTPAIELETGVYQIEVGSFFPAGGMGTAIPDVELVYKLDDADTLDLHLHFLDLSDHPCADVGDLRAETAETLFGLNGFVSELQSIFAIADIAFGNITYDDIDRADLHALRQQDLPRLLRLSQATSGVHVFFVRSIVPVGVQALAGGKPGPPNMPGTRASGVAVAMDTLCYRTWNDLARATAHELARHMGLFRNREPNGRLDPIPDSGDTPDNLMYFSEFGGTYLSPGQRQVLRTFPGLR